VIVDFRPAAQEELRAAVRWYLDSGGPVVAEQFEWTMQRTLRLLGPMPGIGTRAYEGVRLWPLKQFPYTLVYRLHGNVITVLALAHRSRAPGYWRGR